jgi:hypothetical protein
MFWLAFGAGAFGCVAASSPASAARSGSRRGACGYRSPVMRPRMAAATAASSSAGRSIVGTAPDIIGRHLSSKEKVKAGSWHYTRTPATEQKVNKVGNRNPLLTLVGVFCSPKSTGDWPGRLKFGLPSFKSDSWLQRRFRQAGRE